MRKPYPKRQSPFGRRPLDLAVRQISAAGGVCRQETEAGTGHTLLYVNGATVPMRYDTWGESVSTTEPPPARNDDELIENNDPVGPLGLL